MAAFLLLWLPVILSAQSTRVRPSLPDADRHQAGRVFLEHADLMSFDQSVDTDVQVLSGNVQFRKGDMFMYCDSARFNEATSSFDAFRNVRIEQGDTLFVYGDELYYDGPQELAELRAYPGNEVRLINRDVMLQTPVCFYDLVEDVGYYMTGGTLSDQTNRLRSMQGYYYPQTKDAYFYLDVELEGPRDNDTLRIYSDSLTYNTDTGVAELICKSRIVNKDGEILTTLGLYNTRTSVADLYQRSIVRTWRGNTLTGDTLFYDRNSGYGQAFGNMLMTDSAHHTALGGDYGFYNELTDSCFVTGRALAMEYSGADTLYLHGDTIIGHTLADSTHVIDTFHRVRFYRSDIQGICDSLSMVQADSIIYMYDHPVIWNDARQIAGNVIYIHLNDSTADWARLPETGLVAEHIAEDCYNQLTGSDMTVWMADTTLRRLYAEGNVEIIMFPMENDSTYNKFSYVQSSTLDVDFENGQMQKVKLWPETTGKVTPLYLAKRSAYSLQKFRWYGPLRPQNRDDVFSYPPEMADLKASTILGTPRPDSKTIRGTATGRPRPQVPQMPEPQLLDRGEIPPPPSDADTVSADGITVPVVPQIEGEPDTDNINTTNAETNSVK